MSLFANCDSLGAAFNVHTVLWPLLHTMMVGRRHDDDITAEWTLISKKNTILCSIIAWSVPSGTVPRPITLHYFYRWERPENCVNRVPNILFDEIFKLRTFDEIRRWRFPMLGRKDRRELRSTPTIFAGRWPVTRQNIQFLRQSRCHQSLTTIDVTSHHSIVDIYLLMNHLEDPGLKKTILINVEKHYWIWFCSIVFFSILRIDQFFNIKPISDQYQNQYQTNTGINTRSKSYQNQINTRSISSQCQCQSPQGVHSQITASSQRVHSVFTAQNSPHSESRNGPHSELRTQNNSHSAHQDQDQKISEQYQTSTRSIPDRYQIDITINNIKRILGSMPNQ